MPSSPGEHASPGPTLRGRYLRWALFILPLCYGVVPLEVLAHEVLGHGGAAWLSGHEASKFIVTPWGDGFTEWDAPHRNVWIVLGGTVAQVALALAAFLVARCLRPGGAARVGTILFAATCLEWSCFQLLVGYTGGDFNAVASMLEWNGWRALFAIAGGVGAFVVAYVVGAMLMAEARVSFGAGIVSRSRGMAALVFLFVVLPALHLVVPLIGRAMEMPRYGYQWAPLWPFFVPIVAHAEAAVVLFLRSKSVGELPQPQPIGWSAIALAWSSAAALFGCAEFWWRHGV